MLFTYDSLKARVIADRIAERRKYETAPKSDLVEAVQFRIEELKTEMRKVPIDIISLENLTDYIKCGIWELAVQNENCLENIGNSHFWKISSGTEEKGET